MGGMGGGGMPPMGEMSTAINPENYAQYFDEVVNAVDVDADPTGQDPINPILNSYATPGTLLVFPSGEYLMDSQHRISRSGPIGIVGQNAVIRHASVESISSHTVTGGQYRGDTKMFTAGSSGSPFSGTLVFGGFVFDFSQENTGMQCLNAHCTGESVIENIQVYGRQDLGTHGPFRLSTQSPESVMFFRNIDMRHGGEHYANTINTRQTPKRYGPNRPGPSWSTSGTTITSTMSGTIWAENIACGSWPDNGLYLKGGEPGNDVGRKIIRNCVASNSNVANIRTNDGPDWEPHPWVDGNGGTPAAGYEQSTIENCHVIVDDNRDTSIFANQIGIRLDDGAPALRNSRVVLRRPNGVGIRVQGGVSGATLEGVRVDLYQPEAGIVMAGSGSVANSVVNTIGFNSSGAISGISSGVDVRQVSQADVQAEQQQATQNQN
jgi:hypothetical protein